MWQGGIRMAVKIEVKGQLMSNNIAQVYHYFGWDACCPKDISAKLREAAGDEVILEINSPGGYCSAGYEMYTLLMDYEGKVTAHVIEAASAASLLVCAADEALASDTCIFMIHNTQSSTSGDYRDMQASAEALKEFNAGIINAYVRKTGKTREELQALMDNETYMSAQTAIENGFIDGYLFGSPDGQGIEGTADVQGRAVLQAVNSAFPVITDEKAKEIMVLLKMQETSLKTGSEINSTVNNTGKGDKTNMTLEEMYTEHPELRDEVAAIVKDAETKGADIERGRLEALDKIAHNVAGDALEEAKYGNNRIDARELAYQAMLKDRQMAKNYMDEAVEDSASSGVENVGAGLPGEEQADESDSMSAYINAMKKGGNH